MSLTHDVPLRDPEPATPTPSRAGRLRDRTWQARGLLLLILVVAASVRVVGTRFGFPLLVHPDEFAVVDGVIDMAQRNSFEPGPAFNLRPDHVEMKLDYVAFAGYAGIVKQMSIEAAFAADPLPFYWIARLMTAAFGVASVALAYLVGARVSRRVGLVAAALFALFPPFVHHAHFATPDVPLTCAVLLLVYALMRYTASCSWSSLLVAAFAVALAVGIKYPGAVGTVTIAVTVVAAAVRDRAWSRIAVHGVGSAAAFFGFLFLISPTLFTNISGVRSELEVQAAGDRLGNPDYGLLGNMEYYVTTFGQAGGIVLALLSLAGLGAVVALRRLDVLPWFAGVPVWVSLSTLPMTWERWGLPMWVTPLLLASVGLCWLFDRLTAPRARWVPWVVTGVIAVSLVAGTARSLASLLAPDNRSAGLAYARANGITPDETASEGYTPFVPGDPALVDYERDGDGWRVLTDEGEPARFVMLSSGMYDRVLADPSYAEEQSVYAWVIANYEEIATFEAAESPRGSWFEPVAVTRTARLIASMADGDRTGPVIRIFEAPATTP